MVTAFVGFSGFTGLKIGNARGRAGYRNGVRMCDAVKTDSTAAPDAAPSAPTPAKWVPLKKVKSTASWAYSYVDVFGQKGGGSHLDIDLRPSSERGAQAGICPSCNGMKMVKCSLCSGHEFYIDGKVEPCPACNGEVWVECSDCGGTGKQVELFDGWWEEGIGALYKE